MIDNLIFIVIGPLALWRWVRRNGTKLGWYRGCPMPATVNTSGNAYGGKK